VLSVALQVSVARRLRRSIDSEKILSTLRPSLENATGQKYDRRLPGLKLTELSAEMVLREPRKAVIMSRLRLLIAVATTLLGSLSPIGARGGQIVTAEKIQVFTNPSPTKSAYGLDLTVFGAILAKPAPTSTVFTNAPALAKNFTPNDTVTYSSPVPAGPAVKPKNPVTVTYSEKYDSATQNGFVRMYSFTDVNSTVIPAKSLALDSSASFNGTHASLSLLNDSGSALTGTVSVYLNPGFSSLFGTPQFDTLLPDAVSVLPTTSFSLGDGQSLGASPLTADLSDNQYLLVLGIVDTSSGTVDFAAAFASVPEPATLVLFALAFVTEAVYGFSRRRRAAG
jgi:hypothetical protein